MMTIIYHLICFCVFLALLYEGEEFTSYCWTSCYALQNSIFTKNIGRQLLCYNQPLAWRINSIYVPFHRFAVCKEVNTRFYQLFLGLLNSFLYLTRIHCLNFFIYSDTMIPSRCHFSLQREVESPAFQHQIDRSVRSIGKRALDNL